MDWTPVCYFYHGFSFEELVAMYYIADVAFGNSLRDGMNLVAKEYVASKNNNPGVLILSEMAGAAIEMTDALLINPNDTEEIKAGHLSGLGDARTGTTETLATHAENYFRTNG